jgi:type III restriction enzyme
LVAADTARWEQAAAFRLEQAALRRVVQYYARNDGLGLTIPFEFVGGSHHYEPDYLVRLLNNVTLILEIEGMETEEDRAKHQAARRWVEAVNNWSELGCWMFHLCRDPQVLGREMEWLAHEDRPA